MDVDLYRQTIRLPQGGGRPALAMSVIEAGPRDALRTVVFLHGFGGRAAYWQHQLEHFSLENRVLALDLRGHGLTDAPHGRYDIEEICADLTPAFDELDVPQTFALVAHSYGCACAAYWIARQKGRTVEKLVLIAPAVRFRLRPTARMLLRLPAAVLDFVRRAIPKAGLYPESHVVSCWNRNALSVWDGTEWFARLNVPTLVIFGHRDLLFSKTDIHGVARLIPGASEVTIPVTAHQVMVERPGAVNRAIERFIGPAQIEIERRRRREANRRLEQERPWLKFYDARTPYRIKPPAQPLQRMMEIAARRYPSTAALVFYERRLSYRWLDRLANRFAHGLRSLGVEAGTRVALLLPNTPQTLIAYYGILKARGVVVFLNPVSSREDLKTQLEDSGAKIVVCLSLFHRVVREVAPALGIHTEIVTSFKEFLRLRDRLLFTILRQRQEGHGMPRAGRYDGVNVVRFRELLWRGEWAQPEPAPDVDDVAVIQYTSGTTGAQPAGVTHTHRSLAANALQLRHWLPDTRPGDERILAVLPFSHSYGLTTCVNVAPLIAATLILLPNFVSREVLKSIQRYKPTIFPGVPQMYRHLAESPGARRYGISSIRVCVSGGSPLPVEVQESFEKLTHGRVVEGYGLTEAGPVTHANPLHARRRYGSIGVPLPDTEAKIVDAHTGADLPVGEAGELLVRGPQVMQGYLNRPEVTAAVLKDGWLNTGDIARMDEDGFFYIIDRKKDMILAGEYNIYPRDIEEVLYEHPKVLEAAVASVAGPGWHSINAFVVLRPGERATAEELIGFCRARLAEHAVPNIVKFLPKLPRNFIGKVLRRVLIEQSRTP